MSDVLATDNGDRVTYRHASCENQRCCICAWATVWRPVSVVAHAGKIERVGAGTYDVLYDDIDRESDVPEDRFRLLGSAGAPTGNDGGARLREGFLCFLSG